MREGFFRRHLETIVVSAVVAAVTAGAPALARTVADFARNADKVDGKHAVGANASVEDRKGDLVATNIQTGLLPNNIIAKAPDANLLDGRNSTEFIAEGTAAGGDLTGTYAAPEIAPDAVTAAELAPDSVGTDELAADSVGASELAADSVGEPELATNSVTAAEILFDSVGSSELGVDAVGSSELAANSVKSEHLGFIGIATSSILVPGNEPRNGNYVSRTASVFCPEGQRAISGSGHWSGGEDEGELHIVSSRRLRTLQGVEGWTVTGASDVQDGHFLTVEAYCLSP